VKAANLIGSYIFLHWAIQLKQTEFKITRYDRKIEKTYISLLFFHGYKSVLTSHVYPTGDYTKILMQNDIHYKILRHLQKSCSEGVLNVCLRFLCILCKEGIII
jgi:hypothetical protein